MCMWQCVGAAAVLCCHTLARCDETGVEVCGCFDGVYCVYGYVFTCVCAAVAESSDLSLLRV